MIVSEYRINSHNMVNTNGEFSTQYIKTIRAYWANMYLGMSPLLGLGKKKKRHRGEGVLMNWICWVGALHLEEANSYITWSRYWGKKSKIKERSKSVWFDQCCQWILVLRMPVLIRFTNKRYYCSFTFYVVTDRALIMWKTVGYSVFFMHYLTYFSVALSLVYLAPDEHASLSSPFTSLSQVRSPRSFLRLSALASLSPWDMLPLPRTAGYLLLLRFQLNRSHLINQK